MKKLSVARNIILMSLFLMILGGCVYAKGASSPSVSLTPADVEITLSSTLTHIPIKPGSQTQVFQYSGKQVKGPANSFRSIPGSYLGPIIEINTGDVLRVHYTNLIPYRSVIHWHGMKLSEENDGHPRYGINKNKGYLYQFPIKNRAGLYWYHPHPDKKTGPQVYYGLAGLLIVRDEQEKSLNLPGGEYELPVVIQDRYFDRDNQFSYLDNSMQQMIGFLGNEILINGKVDNKYKVSRGSYRLRILNGSNSRIYKLAWSDGRKLTVIGTDGGLLDKPRKMDYVVLGPAERLDLIVDFSDLNKGDELSLVSKYFPDPGSGGMGMMGNMNSGSPQGQAFTLMQFNITSTKGFVYRVPDRLTPANTLPDSSGLKVRKFELNMGGHMRWTINQQTFNLHKYSANEVVRANSTEIWEFINDSTSSGGGMMGMMGGGIKLPHPMHIHGVQYRVLERTAASSSTAWQYLKDGFIDQGWKDTVLVLPGMRVKVLVSFEDDTGLFLYHCHNLEHEDNGMMRNFYIEK